MALGVARSVHGSVLAVNLILTVAILGECGSCLLVLRVNKGAHVDLWLSADVAKLLRDWIGLDLIVRGA